MKKFLIVFILTIICVTTVSCRKKKEYEEEEKSDLLKDIKKEQVAEIYKVEIGGSVYKGADNAPVTIINFSDFQCPFSKRFSDHIHRLMKTYNGKIKYVYKHFPLPFHRMGKPAALAAIAAQNQGKFWEYYEVLYNNIRDISDENLVLWAEELGLDKERFLSDRNSAFSAKILKQDKAMGSRFGVRGTPTIFINGRRIVGANNDIIEKVVLEEIANGENLRAKGEKDIYGKLIKNGLTKYIPPQRQHPAIPQDIYKVEYPSTAPVTGNENADITIVLFKDYECIFSARLHSTIKEIKKEYPDNIRLVYMNLPLRFHKKATLAATAALAAHRQGKFKEINDLLFNQQHNWKKAEIFEKWLEKTVKDTGLNIDRFKKDFKDPSLKQIVDKDINFASNLGVRGTPGSFINGRFISGALPVESFREVINEELERAERIKTDELKGTRLYRELIKDGKPGIGALGAKQAEPFHKISDIRLSGKEPKSGPAKAPVTIVKFSDFQCPFCRKGADTMEKIVKEYEEKITLIFKHSPLDFNKSARTAALFTIAVKNIYGDEKFFEIGRILFDNQEEWKDSPKKHFEKYASELRLNWNKLKTKMNEPETLNILEKDIAEAAKQGVRGVPVFFINGKRVSGVRKPLYFKSLIDDLLKGSI